MHLHQYCGSYRFIPFANGSFGACWFELCVFVPSTLLYMLLSIFYLFVFWKHLAFESLHSLCLYLRFSVDVLILCNSAVNLALGFFLPFHNDLYASNANLFVVHHSLTVILWIVISLHDFLLGKSLHFSSRGPLLHLLFSFLYFFVCVFGTWSLIRDTDLLWEPFITVGLYVHIGLLSVHFLSKVPIIFAIEEPRRRDARLVRQHLNTSSTPPWSRTLNAPAHFSTDVVQNEDSVNIFSKIFFCWMNETVSKGYFGELCTVNSLPHLPKRLNVYNLEASLTQTLEADLKGDEISNLASNLGEKPSLKSAAPFLRLTFRSFTREFIALGFIKFFISAVNLCGPVILNYFIISLEDLRINFLHCMLWGLGLVLISLFSSVVGTNFNYRMATFGYKIRVAVCGMVYRFILSVRTTSLHSLGTGSLVNYLTSDVDRIVNLAPSIHELWAMPLQFFIAISLLYHQLGLACLVGIGFLLILLPVNRILANQIGKFSRRLMMHKDSRIKLISECLQSMTPVKLACWESLMRNRIIKSRKQELIALRGQKLLDAGCVFCWAACPALLASSTFAVYVAMGNVLEASVVFTSLSLFGMLIGPMTAFPWVINGVVEATVSVQRINRLLRHPRGPFRLELTNMSVTECETVTNSDQELPFKPSSSSVISIRNASFYWSDPESPVLTKIDLQVKQGQLVGILGQVGSGKSALLLSILGELQELYQKSTDLESSSRSGIKFAYLSQTPWLFTGTIRENILFYSPENTRWLNTVLDACNLIPDLDRFPKGLDTHVGEAGGSCLSGGQKVRVCLARAVYQNADVYLLDDPLSALDTKVGLHIIQHCFLGLLAQKTRIIATNQSDWLLKQNVNYERTADVIVELKDGRIINQIPASVNHMNGLECHASVTTSYVSSNCHAPLSDVPILPIDINETNIGSPNHLDVSEDELINCEIDQANLNDDVNLIDPVNRTSDLFVCALAAPSCDKNSEIGNWERFAFGSINTNVYKSYVKAVGYLLTLLIVLSIIFMQGTRNSSDWWLSHWVQMSNTNSQIAFSLNNVSFVQLDVISRSNLIHLKNFQSSSLPLDVPTSRTYNTHNSSGSYYLIVYGGIVAANLLATIFRAILFAIGGLVAASVIHEQALDSVLEARLSYFDKTPHGRILNRFSSDVSTIDDSLPFILNILLANLAGLFGVTVIVCISLPSLFLLILPLLFIFWSIQRLYREASRDLKRISSVVRSPLYAHFTDTLNGLAVIHGFHGEICFRRLTIEKLSTQLRAELASLAAGSWLSIRLQLIGTGVIAGVVCFSLLGRLLNLTEIAAAGLSAAYALNISTLMTNTIYDLTETEKNLVAVERCQELIDDVPLEVDTVPIIVTAPKRPKSARRHCLIDPSCVDTSLFANWPSAGCIEFRNVSLTYYTNAEDAKLQNQINPSTSQALCDVNFIIQPGERVGIIGRTGSGKSSLIKVLMRLVDHLPGPHTNKRIAKQVNFFGASGQVFVDGVDIRTVPLSILRSRILTICQEPFLISGCLRDNLDPENQLPDSLLHDVLVKCHIASNYTEANDWLTREVGESGRDISAGQRQLICLARALLRQPRPKIICLDEATASVDDECEELVHDILDREFRDTTLLLIAHRLSSVRRLCGRVMIMQSGCLVVQGESDKVIPNDSDEMNLNNQNITDLIVLHND